MSIRKEKLELIQKQVEAIETGSFDYGGKIYKKFILTYIRDWLDDLLDEKVGECPNGCSEGEYGGVTRITCDPTCPCHKPQEPKEECEHKFSCLAQVRATGEYFNYCSNCGKNNPSI